ncbi:unnamed protein product [Clonostachys rosea]|uniref:Uncharacterized protein n=1 Tax=Bionectria ochroleuca TaxID=29856 RepID=A0ABY6UWD8_BIOOC|nr:unnamed protein product [Clonostachys rosea]
MSSLKNFLTHSPSNSRETLASLLEGADNSSTRLFFWVVLSFMPSIVLLALSRQDICLPLGASSWIKAERPALTVIITSVSILLAWLQKSVAKEAAESLAAHRSHKGQVNHLSFSSNKSAGWAAIVRGRFSGLSVPWSMVLSSLVFFVWAGALTPEASEMEMPYDIEIPYYAADDTHEHWNQLITNQEMKTEKTDFGSFSYSPIYTVLGSILHSVSAATATDNATQTYLKLDNTGYRYLNRSYGVGASAGFDEDIQKKARQDLKKVS